MAGSYAQQSYVSAGIEDGLDAALNRRESEVLASMSAGDMSAVGVGGRQGAYHLGWPEQVRASTEVG